MQSVFRCVGRAGVPWQCFCARWMLRACVRGSRSQREVGAGASVRAEL